MFQFNHFYDDWLGYEPIFVDKPNKTTDLKVNLSLDFFKSIKLDKNSLLEYQVTAAEKVAETLGDNIAVCVSGGVDSQAMLDCFHKAKIKITPYIFVFQNELNQFDIQQVKQWCFTHRMELIEVPFNILSFLTRDNIDYGLKYKSASPHFNAHYYFCNYLRNKGHTGVCFGGMTPYFSRSNWGVNYNRNVMNYINYSEIEQYPVQGNFLSYYPKLTWAIAMLTPKTDIDISVAPDDGLFVSRSQAIRYANKVLGYYKAQLDVIESKKYSGFEGVKKYYTELTNDGWAFEKQFRYPLESELQIINTITRFTFENDVEDYLLSVCGNY